MKLKVFSDDSTFNEYEILKEKFYENNLQDRVFYIASSSKEQNALNILKSYFSGAKSILFDATNKTLKNKIESFGIGEFALTQSKNSIFDDKEFCFLYFTSGSTGEPSGALKTLTNIEDELKALRELLSDYKIKKVVVCVPFIHFYGSLFGLFYPLYNGLDIILKEHFLPNDLLDFIDDETLVVATPLYIKALSELSSSKDLSKALFVSSTAPLGGDIAKEFTKKYSTNILQIFGSTESGGIAYKFNNDEFWRALDGVGCSVNSKNELRVTSSYVSLLLYENGFKHTNGTLETFDYVELKDNKFKLLGRSSQIFKLAGKRYSTLQIENILEGVDGINKALVYVKNSNNHLRSEILDISIEASREVTKREIQLVLKEHLSNLKFLLDFRVVDKIAISATGKKMLCL